MDNVNWNPWKLTTFAVLLVLATALVTGLVIANLSPAQKPGSPAAPPSQFAGNWATAAPGGQTAGAGGSEPEVRPAPTVPTRADTAACNRYASAHEIHCYSGIAPVLERSGHRQWIHVRRACPKFLRQTFHEWASHSIGFSQWARDYYQHQRAKNKSHHAAVRALAFKWIRILYRCWKDRTPYDEARYLETLRRRHSPKPDPTSTLRWEQHGGFFKFAGTSSS